MIYMTEAVGYVTDLHVYHVYVICAGVHVM